MVSGICAIVVEGFVDVWLVGREWLGGLVVGRLLDWKSLQAMLKCRRQHGPAGESASATAATSKSLLLLSSEGQLRSLMLTTFTERPGSHLTTRIPHRFLRHKVPGSVIWLLVALVSQSSAWTSKLSQSFDCAPKAFMRVSFIFIVFNVQGCTAGPKRSRSGSAFFPTPFFDRTTSGREAGARMDTSDIQAKMPPA